MSEMDDESLGLEREFAHQIGGPPFHPFLGLVANSVDPAARAVTVSLDFREEFGHMPGSDAFHGGIIAALADVAGHAAVAVWHGRATPTVTLQIDYLSPARGKTLVARGLLRKLGRTLGRADVELSVDGRLVAIARGTFSTGKG